MSKVICVDFKNKQIISEVQIPNNVVTSETDLPEEKSEIINDSYTGNSIMRNFPEDYFDYINDFPDTDFEDNTELSYTHPEYGKYYLTRGIERSDDGQLIIGGIKYPVEFNTQEEFLEIQEKSNYITACLKDATSIGYILNATDVITIIHCITTPILGLFMNKTDYNFKNVFGKIETLSHILDILAGLVIQTPDNSQNQKTNEAFKTKEIREVEDNKEK